MVDVHEFLNWWKAPFLPYNEMKEDKNLELLRLKLHTNFLALEKVDNVCHSLAVFAVLPALVEALKRWYTCRIGRGQGTARTQQTSTTGQ